jgi:aspartate 1-decarboxylase
MAVSGGNGMIWRRMLGSKIHKATVTQADINYEGSISISPELLKAADILPFEAVSIWNVTSGTRLETYAIEGQSGSSDICINGAAAHLVSPGDLIIIARFIQVNDEDCVNYRPKIIFVDKQNRIKEIREEVAGPEMAANNPAAKN